MYAGLSIIRFKLHQGPKVGQMIKSRLPNWPAVAQIARNGPYSDRMLQDGPKWRKTGQNCPKCTNHKKWLKWPRIAWIFKKWSKWSNRRLRLAKTGSNGPNWTNQTKWSKWPRKNQIAEKWPKRPNRPRIAQLAKFPFNIILICVSAPIFNIVLVLTIKTRCCIVSANILVNLDTDSFSKLHYVQ